MRAVAAQAAGVAAEGHPIVLPVAYAVDPDGPDDDGTSTSTGRWPPAGAHERVLGAAGQPTGHVRLQASRLTMNEACWG